MNLSSYAGDNRDHGKGFVIHALRQSLDHLHVDAMITDQPWPNSKTESSLNKYREFLRLPDVAEIVNAQTRYQGGTLIKRNGKAEDYFQPHYGQDYDLFMDPDDGIHIDGGSKDVKPSVVEKLLPTGTSRVLMIYITPTRDTREGCTFNDHFTRWFGGKFSAFLCWLGGNGILFLARSENERLKELKSDLSDALGPFSASHIQDILRN